jgi:DNA-binding beta-propeller fold protein YncE
MRKSHLAASLLGCVAAVAGVWAHDGPRIHAPFDPLALVAVVRTGAGEHTYESVPDWCKMPPGREYVGSTHGGVVEDKDGNIYFTMDGGGEGILVYKPDGTFLKALGGEKLTGIHGLNINDENGEQFLYAAQPKHKRAVKLKLDGTEVWQIPFEEVNKSGKYQDPGRFVPTSVVAGPDGSVFIADGYGSNWIHKFDKDQKYVSSFGGPGKEPGQFTTCHGIGLDKRGEKPLLLVCDRENRRLQHFDLDGKFVAVVAENLRRPCSLSIHGDYVAVAELEARVVILDKNNKEVAHLGDNPEKGQWAKFDVPPTDWKPGIFTAPHGVSFDKAGDVYVMDWNKSGRLSKFKRVGGEAKQAAAKAGAEPRVAAR